MLNMNMDHRTKDLETDATAVLLKLVEKATWERVLREFITAARFIIDFKSSLPGEIGAKHWEKLKVLCTTLRRAEHADFTLLIPWNTNRREQNKTAYAAY